MQLNGIQRTIEAGQQGKQKGEAKPKGERPKGRLIRLIGTFGRGREIRGKCTENSKATTEQDEGDTTYYKEEVKGQLPKKLYQKRYRTSAENSKGLLEKGGSRHPHSRKYERAKKETKKDMREWFRVKKYRIYRALPAKDN